MSVIFTLDEALQIERELVGHRTKRRRRVRAVPACHAQALDLVAQELIVVANTSVGRRTFRWLEDEEFPLRDASNLAEWAQVLDIGPEGERRDFALDLVLRHAKDRRELGLVVIVALRPVLERIVTLVDRYGADEEVSLDLLADLWELMARDGQLVEPMLAELRRLVRHGARARKLRRDRTEAWSDDLDVAERGADPAEIISDHLAQLVRRGVISKDDAEVLVRTEVLGERLAEVAAERGVPYKTLQSQRLRMTKVAARHLWDGENR